jgi:hypothetical protein
MRKLEITATTRNAHSNDLDAQVFRHSIEKYVLNHAGESYRFHLNRYMVHVPSALFNPLDRFVLETATNSVIDTDMVRERDDPSLAGFGNVISHDAQGQQKIECSRNDLEIQGPVLCISPWGQTFSNQIFHILMGIAHCDDVLGEALPILVPDDLSEREKSNLALIGVGPERFIPVPRASACRVHDALVPSKSFIRHSTFGPKMGKVNYGFFFEPNDIKTYAARVRNNPSVSAPDDGAAARVLYFSRKDGGSRRTTNEDEAVAALAQFDTRYIMPLETPIEEIASAVSRADVVISAFGAATLHFLAARPGATLIEIDHPANDQFSRAICRIRGCHHVICTRVSDRPRDFSDRSDNPVDIKELTGLVTDALARYDAEG